MQPDLIKRAVWIGQHYGLFDFMAILHIAR